ncbi:MAG: hypothetical protein K2J83_00925 [Clostridia bacterium]|nr:hypothetical protein [Clostridia bacterium]
MAYSSFTVKKYYSLVLYGNRLIRFAAYAGAPYKQIIQDLRYRLLKCFVVIYLLM